VTSHVHGVSFAEAARVWARVAALSFGGPAGQIAVMHRILVEEKRWIGERRFLHALNFCMLLPGPEAQQLAIYIGWLMHRTAGGVMAGGLFVLPGFLALTALSVLYAEFGRLGPVSALFFGLKAAVLVIVLQAVLRIGKRALRNRTLVGLAAAAFLALFAFHLPFPLVVLSAGLIGFFGSKAGLKAFAGSGGHGAAAEASDDSSLLGETLPDHAGPNLKRGLVAAAVLLVLWLGPIAILVAALGPGEVFSRIALFFGKMAVVTFGGAYAVLAYVAQEAVQTYHWLKPGEMLDGLGMAETTPGPLIIVTQFVGFMGAFRSSGGLPPLVAGLLGGTLTTWVTFTPCFLWIFLGAPFAEMLRHARALNAALTAITAAVVGVILNLAVWFALHTLFGEVSAAKVLGVVTLEAPAPGSIDLAAAALALSAAVAAFRFKVGPIPLLVACAVIGMGGYGVTQVFQVGL
jgi:chromate transporter